MQQLTYNGKAANMTPGYVYSILKTRTPPPGQKQGTRYLVNNDRGQPQWVAASMFSQPIAVQEPVKKQRARQHFGQFELVDSSKRTFKRITKALKVANLAEHYAAASKAIQRNRVWHHEQSKYVLYKKEIQPNESQG